MPSEKSCWILKPARKYSQWNIADAIWNNPHGLWNILPCGKIWNKIRSFICRRNISYAKRISHYEVIFHSFRKARISLKKMPPQNSDEDLNPQKVGSDSVSEPMTFQDVTTKISLRNSDIDLSRQEYFKVALRSKA